MPESQLGTVRRFLRFLREDDDPFVHRHLDAPIDSERSSSSEDHAAALAREEFDRGEYVPLEELEAEFGRD
jgi:hypothetical protein